MPVHSLATMTWLAVRELPAARTVADRFAARGIPVVWLPPLTTTAAPFASEFAGTLHTSAEATTAIVTGIVRSLGAHGVRVVAIANAHHDPAHVASLRQAV